MESSSLPPSSSAAVPISEIVLHHPVQKFEPHNNDSCADAAAVDNLKEPKHPIDHSHTKSIPPIHVLASSKESNNTTTTTTPVDIPLEDLYIDRNPRSHYPKNPSMKQHQPDLIPTTIVSSSSNKTTGSAGSNSKDGQPPLTVLVPHGTTASTSSTIHENPTTVVLGATTSNAIVPEQHLSGMKEGDVPSLDEDTVLIQTFMECFGVIQAQVATSTEKATSSSHNSSDAASGGSGSHTRKNLNGIYVCVRHVNYPIIYGMYASSSTTTSPNVTTAAQSQQHPPQHPKQQHNNHNEEPFRIHSCRFCYMDETRCGIIARNNYNNNDDEQQKPKSIYQILQLVQAYAMNRKMVHHTTTAAGSAADSSTHHKNGSDLLVNDSERSTGTDSVGDYTVSALFLHNNSSANSVNKHSTTGPASIPEEITTTVSTWTSSSNAKNSNINGTARKMRRMSLASRILSSYRSNSHNIMELSLKRIHQVQNFTIQVYKKQILEYQELIIKLQYDLLQKDQQYQATIKQLRRTIQQDCKVIKTMATQQQDVEYALGLSSQHQTTVSSATGGGGGSTIDNDPLLTSMLGIGESSSHSVSTTGTTSPHKPSITINPKIVPFRTRSSMSQSIQGHQQPTEATIHESGQEDETETSVNTNDIIVENTAPHSGTGLTVVATVSEPIPPPASRGAILKLQQNWNRPKLRSRNNNNAYEDELGGMKSSHEIFQSFRGGLLDIPRSPPALIRHDNISIESDDAMNPDMEGMTQEQRRLQQQQRKIDGTKNNKKLMMNSDMLSALQIPTRGLLSRSDSMIIPTNPNANISSNGEGLTPKNNNNSNNGNVQYNHNLANLLAAKLQQQELDFRTNHGSDYYPIRPLNSPPPITATAKPTANILYPHYQQSHQQLPSIPIQSPDGKSPAPPINSAPSVLPMMNITIPAMTSNDTSTKKQGGDGAPSEQDYPKYENDTAVEDSDADIGVEDENDEFYHSSPDQIRGSNKCIFSVTGATCHDKFGDNGTYTGTILVTEGLPHGHGKMNYDSGRIYDGEWISGQWHGRGQLLNPNGDSYDGEFFFDARHGHGIYQWDNGDIYVGNFTSDKRHGRGKFSFHNGNVYEGEFCDGLFDGYGKYKFDGGSYEGNWKDGRYNGAGILIYGNTGGKYEGEFRNSVAHGFGTEIMPDGKQRRGVWIDGKPTEYLE